MNNQKNINKTVAWFGVLGIFIFFLIGIYFFSGNDSLFECVDTPLKTEVSPSGKYMTSIYSRGCGATTGDSIHIEIEKKGFFSSSQKILVIKEGYFFEPRWEDDNNLVIYSSVDINEGNLDVFLIEKKLDDIRIDFIMDKSLAD